MGESLDIIAKVDTDPKYGKKTLVLQVKKLRCEKKSKNVIAKIKAQKIFKQRKK